jgi:hypothetical protein
MTLVRRPQHAITAQNAARDALQAQVAAVTAAVSAKPRKRPHAYEP